ncbi:hypothetical protein IWZ01DRAFT_266492 [Phyllosticta capitalensis]
MSKGACPFPGFREMSQLLSKVRIPWPLRQMLRSGASVRMILAVLWKKKIPPGYPLLSFCKACKLCRQAGFLRRTMSHRTLASCSALGFCTASSLIWAEVFRDYRCRWWKIRIVNLGQKCLFSIRCRHPAPRGRRRSRTSCWQRGCVVQMLEQGLNQRRHWILKARQAFRPGLEQLLSQHICEALALILARYLTHALIASFASPRPFPEKTA